MGANRLSSPSADAVKFQAFNQKALFGIEKEVQREGAFGEYSTVELPGQLPVNWLPDLKQKADNKGIEFMCSAFSPGLLDDVDKVVNVHKIASAEMTHIRMLQKLAKIGKPVIMSTGASGVRDIERALEILGSTPVILLYCVASYPAREVDLLVMELLRDQFKLPVGFSDHTIDVLTTPRLSIALKACVLEKHVNFVEAVGPDSPHSLSTDQFKRMVKSIKNPEPSRIGYTGEENGFVLRHNRRLIAVADIKAGDVFEEDKNIGVYRSLKDDAHGLSPFAIDRVLGRVATKDIKAGDSVGPGDFA
jgi:N-acetylneuraminate synthase